MENFCLPSERSPKYMLRTFRGDHMPKVQGPSGKPMLCPSLEGTTCAGLVTRRRWKGASVHESISSWRST